MLQVGKRVYINDSIGEVIILSVKDDYLILCRLDSGRIVKANTYYLEGNKIVWEHGEYFNNLDDYIVSLK